MNHLSTLAEFVATAAPSKNVIDKTALILADSVGLPGTHHTEVRMWVPFYFLPKGL